MKKLFAILSVAGMLCLGSVSVVLAQDEAPQATTEAVAAPAADFSVETDVEGTPMHQALKTQYLDGGVGWMTPVLLCLILGLAIAIERIIYLNLATTNTKKFIAKVEEALNEGGVEAAKELCRNTRGPVASIFYQGLDRYDEGVDMVEKTVVSYGSVQMAQLESGLSWLSLFIALSPSLGFLGTVVGMVMAFDAIAAAGDMSPTIVAGGMKTALLTTVAGLISAIILQIFYNYLLSKIESLVLAMEDSSISLIDILTKYNKK
ncbi:MAG: MotA/TolQ/ExbB proton channel family protein [Rikenellaceae bacterium]|jgi:biopolymer transport protein ExbB|nr:MotA/TolQ/ExbB proton channel family protein [Rikenellaceae bacterium]